MMSATEVRPEEQSPPLVSVIIPCIDDTYLVEMLNSLASQQGAPPFEVLVVDGSHTGAGKRLEDWQGRLRLQLVHGARGGVAGELRNTGAGASRGSFLLFVDADDAVDRGYVSSMADALESHDVASGGVDLSLLNPGVRAPIHAPESGLLTDMAFLPFAGAGTLGIRRSLFQDVGGFDPMLRSYEAADLCWRIQLAGNGPPVLVSEARLHHRLERGRIRLWRKAVASGQAQAFLYERYRRSGMPRESLSDALLEWCSLPWRLYRGFVGHSTSTVLRDVATRIGRLQGSLRYHVPYP
jgi:glycosyltransferase involved in cell wall biosynthesis